MEIRLDQIADEPYRWQDDQVVPPQALDREDVVGLGEIRWGGSVTRVSAGFLFRANLAYEQSLSCSRCLEPVNLPVTGEVELLLMASSEEPLVGEHELEEEDLSVLYIHDEILDTQPLLLEQLQLGVPMRPLCSEECRGLCPVCGANRDRQGCDCEDEVTDPRWAALDGLRKRLDD